MKGKAGTMGFDGARLFKDTEKDLLLEDTRSIFRHPYKRQEINSKIKKEIRYEKLITIDILCGSFCNGYFSFISKKLKLLKQAIPFSVSNGGSNFVN